MIFFPFHIFNPFCLQQGNMGTKTVHRHTHNTPCPDEISILYLLCYFFLTGLLYSLSWPFQFKPVSWWDSDYFLGKENSTWLSLSHTYSAALLSLLLVLARLRLPAWFWSGLVIRWICGWGSWGEVSRSSKGTRQLDSTTNSLSSRNREWKVCFIPIQPTTSFMILGKLNTLSLTFFFFFLPKHWGK